jgi:hypothetical protein
VAYQDETSIMSVPLVRVGIIDSDVLIDDLIAHAEDPAGGSLFTRRTGSIRWLASAHVLTEMYRADALGNRHKFDKIAGQSIGTPWNISADKLRQEFETNYLPAISFVDVEGVMTRHEVALAVEKLDPKDKPTGQLAALLGPQGSWSSPATIRSKPRGCPPWTSFRSSRPPKCLAMRR